MIIEIFEQYVNENLVSCCYLNKTYNLLTTSYLSLHFADQSTWIFRHCKTDALLNNVTQQPVKAVFLLDKGWFTLIFSAIKKQPIDYISIILYTQQIIPVHLVGTPWKWQPGCINHKQQTAGKPNSGPSLCQIFPSGLFATSSYFSVHFFLV